MEKGGGSRLMLMQARFQQKQMQEREMKIASLYEAQQARALDRVRHSPSNGVSSNSNSSLSSPPQPVSHQPGKVRQMFEERRTKAGIDKSYPLQPIHNTEKTRKALPNGYTKVTATKQTVTQEKKANKTHTTTHSVRRTQKTQNFANGSGDLNHNHEPDLNSVKQALAQCISESHSQDEVDKAENNYLIENETFPESLAPVPTPRSPEPVPEVNHQPKAPPRRSPPSKSSPAKKPAATPPRRVTSDNSVSDVNKARPAMQKSVNSFPTVARKQTNSAVTLSTKPSSSSPSPRKARQAESSASGAGPACVVCGRHFAADRLDKHQEICKKAHAKKRKPFDALKHRLAGTEAEPFISKLRKNPSTTSNAKPNLNSTWRQKHQEFIQAIRAAKQVQAHLNAGGKLSDLPPPPPSENPDYVQCPHCSRRFNQSAAERHIPKCKSYQFNKPKPAPKRR